MLSSTYIASAECSTLEPLVRKLNYWNPLDEDDRAAVLGLPHSVRTLERNHYVVREFDRPQHCCVMLKGFAVRQKVVVGGLRQICSIHMRGEMVDLQNSMFREADHSVQMLTSGTVAVIPKSEIVRLAFERPAVGKAMWTDTLVDGSIFREWIANIGRRDARSRLSHLLCEFALRLKVAGLGEQTRYEIPMTQEQLADATGLTAVHVNRTIKSLESDGLIERRGARGITIGDWRNLAAVADFNSTYLHLHERDPVSL